MEQETPGRSTRRGLPDRARKGRSAGSEEGGATEQNESLIARVIRVATGHDPREEKNSTRATDMLRDDHRKVRQLFREFKDAGEREHASRKKIVDQITRELDAHAQIEEKIFYQAFRDVSEEEPKKVVRESFEEHKIVKTLLAELAPMKASDEQFEAKVTVLKENVEHHAEEEEDELFPAAEKLFGDEKLEDLGQRMKALKDRILGETAAS
ncbi:MAG: hemerythrin domain-containing protein [Acidobacteriota bacterium]